MSSHKDIDSYMEDNKDRDFRKKRDSKKAKIARKMQLDKGKKSFWGRLDSDLASKYRYKGK
jgi:hypothetical protein